MAIDRKLNFLVPVETEAGDLLVRSQPFSAQFFKRNFLVISKTFGRLHAEGLGFTTAPRIAAFMLAQVEREMAGLGEDDNPPPSPILNEIRRATTVDIPGQGNMPWDQVVGAKLMSEEDIEEVENAIVFFTVASAMYHHRDRAAFLSGAANLWNARLEFSPTTAPASSSPTSKPIAPTGETAKASSIPR